MVVAEDFESVFSCYKRSFERNRMYGDDHLSCKDNEGQTTNQWIDDFEHIGQEWLDQRVLRSLTWVLCALGWSKSFDFLER